MSMDVTLPDGTVIKGVPDGTTKEQLAVKLKAKGMTVPDSWMKPARLSPMELSAKLKKEYAAANTPEEREKRYQKFQDQMVSEMSPVQRIAAGFGKAFVDTGRGVEQMFGKLSPQDVALRRQEDAALMRTGAGKTGNVLGYIAEAVPAGMAASMAAPAVVAAVPALGSAALTGVGAKTALGGATGAAQGYAAPYASTGEHVANTLVGGGLGALMPGAGAAAGKLVRGIATPAARTLAEGGVELTPGQMLGGMAKTAEDKLTSVPIVGGAIRKAQQRATDTFNTATVNKALEPLQESVGRFTHAGYDAVGEGRRIVSRAYDKTLSQMSGKLDTKLSTDIASTINDNINALGHDQAKKLVNIIDDQVIQKLGKGQQIQGRDIKSIISKLGDESRSHMQSMAPDDQKLGQAFSEIQDHIKDMLKRQNPKSLSKQLEAADAAHARMIRVENAASKIGAEEGVFTPAHLRNAVRAEDSSYKKRAVSQGNALMQDWADAAKSTLPSKIPDSGTAGRMGAADLLANTAMLPVTATTGALAHAAYSRPAQWLMQRAMMPRQNPVTNYLAHLATQRLGNPANALAAGAALPQPTPQQ